MRTRLTLPSMGHGPCTGEMEAMHYCLIDNNNKTLSNNEEPREGGYDTLKLIKEGEVLDQQFVESPGDQLSLGVLKRGKKRVKMVEQKEHKRCRNWTEHGETESLINLKLLSLCNRDKVSRFGSNEPVWEDISRQLSGRIP
jgi:hypothetical protein